MNRRKFVKSVSAIAALSTISGAGLLIPYTRNFDNKNHSENEIQIRKKTLIIGIGGGAGNVVNFMYNKGFNNVRYIITDTDISSFDKSPVQNKIQLGKNLTKGSGTYNNPQTGRLAAIENISDFDKYFRSKDIEKILLIACLGGGTGTGSTPVIAKAAKNSGFYTIGIVTTPFLFEGKIRMERAQNTISLMNTFFNSMQIINNEFLRFICDDMFVREALIKSDEHICTVARKQF